MAHLAQKVFFHQVKLTYPEYFKGVNVVDFGSRDINGSLKELFEDSDYFGLDIHEGKNVDIVCKAKDYICPIEGGLDTVVSAQMLEHDEEWLESLSNMYKVLRKGGLMVVSVSAPGSNEHGTSRTTCPEWGSSPDYYKNIEFKDILAFLSDIEPTILYIERGNKGCDYYFYLIK